MQVITGLQLNNSVCLSDLFVKLTNDILNMAFTVHFLSVSHTMFLVRLVVVEHDDARKPDDD